MFIKSISAVLAVALMAQQTTAHLSIWHPSMYGEDPNNNNSDNMSQPLQDFYFGQWWAHDVRDQPPRNGAVLELPANGKVDLEMSSNKALTSMGQGLKPNPRVAPVPWENENGWGNMHAPGRNDVAGSALAIAYKSDIYDVTPRDFVIFSVVHDSPARQLQSWDIPDLPSCPNGKCICAWFWIHNSIGGTDQMYMTPFDCTVKGATNTKPLGKPQPPVKCDDGTPCVTGAKSPMYWKNYEGNNMPEPGHYAPTYSDKYGYKEGAQKDIFQDGKGNPNPNNVYNCYPGAACVTVQEYPALKPRPGSAPSSPVVDEPVQEPETPETPETPAEPEAVPSKTEACSAVTVTATVTKSDTKTVTKTVTVVATSTSVKSSKGKTRGKYHRKF